MRGVTTVLMILMALPTPAVFAAENPPLTEASDTKLPASVDDDTSRLRVQVDLGNGQKLKFLIDTAATRTVIASDVAARLKLVGQGTVRVRNIGGTDNVPSVLIPSLQIGTQILHDVQAPSLIHENLGGEGLIGLDCLKGQRMTIDFRNGALLTIVQSSATSNWIEPVREPGEIVVKARSKFGELILTDAEIDGHAIAVVIDTGSQDSVGNAPLFKLLKSHFGATALQQVTLLSVTGRKLTADFGQVNSVRIGGFTVNNLPVAFTNASTFHQFGLDHKPAILLGVSALRLFNKVTLDFPQRRISFLLTPPKA